MRTQNMDQNRLTTTTSMADSRASLAGYESQSSHTQHSMSDADRGSRASSLARSDVNSDTSRYIKVKKPINEAVTTAFDDANQQHNIPPELLQQITSQITANVLQHFKTNNVPLPTTTTATNITTAQPTAAAPEVHDSASSVANSPPLDRSKVYTPPSPHRDVAGPKLTSPTHVSFSSDSGRPPSPPSTARGASPTEAHRPTDDSDGKDEKNTRPQGPLRTLTGGDVTTLERCWGLLFNSDKPTQRMGQFLRGIAMHIIEEYEPKNSLVITPDKLQKYYEETKIPKEYYPWSEIFDDRTSSISRMFRELRVEHFLTQDSFSERPDIPALTPNGFATWMTMIFLANPELEFERLSYTLRHMPINNPDDRKERFPKELSRRMFPSDGDSLLASRLAKSMRTHCHVKLPLRKYSSSDSDSQRPKLDHATTVPASSAPSNDYLHAHAESGPLKRPSRSSQRRASYNGRRQATSAHDFAGDIAVDDDPEPTLAPQPIERERKPYVAQPGGGKSYDQVDGTPLTKIHTQPPPQSHTSQQLQPPSMDGKLGRSPSVTSNGRASEASSRYVPVSVHQQSASTNDLSNQEPRARPRSGSFAGSLAGSQHRSTRNRSPSATRSNSMRYPDADYRGGSSSAEASNVYNNGPKWRDPRYERESHQRASFSDARDRGREPRARFQSVSAADAHRYHPNDDSYHALSGHNPAGDSMAYNGYPPNSFRSKQ